LLFKIPLILDGFSFLEEPNILLSLIPIIVYFNAETDKTAILSDNKEKAGIYQWTHLESGKKYIGSTVDLSKRLRCYYTISYLTCYSNSHIFRAILKYDYSALV